MEGERKGTLFCGLTGQCVADAEAILAQCKKGLCTYESGLGITGNNREVVSTLYASRLSGPCWAAVREYQESDVGLDSLCNPYSSGIYSRVLVPRKICEEGQPVWSVS